MKSTLVSTIVVMLYVESRPMGRGGSYTNIEKCGFQAGGREDFLVCIRMPF